MDLKAQKQGSLLVADSFIVLHQGKVKIWRLLPALHVCSCSSGTNVAKLHLCLSCHVMRLLM